MLRLKKSSILKKCAWKMMSLPWKISILCAWKKLSHTWQVFKKYPWSRRTVREIFIKFVRENHFLCVKKLKKNGKNRFTHTLFFHAEKKNTGTDHRFPFSQILSRNSNVNWSDLLVVQHTFFSFLQVNSLCFWPDSLWYSTPSFHFLREFLYFQF